MGEQTQLSMLCSARMPGLLTIFLLLAPLSLLADSVTITADQWSRPRNGEWIADVTTLKKLIGTFDNQPDAQIVIRYAADENSTLWAEELRSWLVSLGIPSRRITLSAGLDNNEILIVETRP